MIRKICILMLLTGIVAAFFFHRANVLPTARQHVQQPEKVDSPVSSSGISELPNVSSESDTAVISKIAGLQAYEEPLINAFEDLKHQAMRGDTAASCRLATELQRCSNAKRALEVASIMTQSPNSPGNMAEQMLKTNEALASLCDGVTPEMLSEAYRFQKMTAQRGGAYVKWLIARPEIDQQDFLSNLDAWADYRQRADAFVRSALVEQSGNDLELLLSIYSPIGATVYRPPYRVEDRVTFLALFEVAQQRGVNLSASMLAAAQIVEQSLTSEERNLLTVKEKQLSTGFKSPLGDGLLRSFLPPNPEEFCK